MDDFYQRTIARVCALRARVAGALNLELERVHLSANDEGITVAIDGAPPSPIQRLIIAAEVAPDPLCDPAFVPHRAAVISTRTHGILSLAPSWLRGKRAGELLAPLDEGRPLSLPWHVRGAEARPGSVVGVLLAVARAVGGRVVNWPRRRLRPRSALSLGGLS